jgi:hypothetical protein
MNHAVSRAPIAASIVGAIVFATHAPSLPHARPKEHTAWPKLGLHWAAEHLGATHAPPKLSENAASPSRLASVPPASCAVGAQAEERHVMPSGHTAPPLLLPLPLSSPQCRSAAQLPRTDAAAAAASAAAAVASSRLDTRTSSASNSASCAVKVSPPRVTRQ